MTRDEVLSALRGAKRRVRVEVRGKPPLLVDVVHVRPDHVAVHPAGWSMSTLVVEIDQIENVSAFAGDDAWEIAIAQSRGEATW